MTRQDWRGERERMEKLANVVELQFDHLTDPQLDQWNDLATASNETGWKLHDTNQEVHDARNKSQLTGGLLGVLGGGLAGFAGGAGISKLMNQHPMYGAGVGTGAGLLLGGPIGAGLAHLAFPRQHAALLAQQREDQQRDDAAVAPLEAFIDKHHMLPD